MDGTDDGAESAGFSLDGVVAIVTGGASGLGRAMALGLARAGARVVATASRQIAQLGSLAREGGSGAGEIVAAPGDVTVAADCERIVSLAVERFGGLHVLVNNAGRGMKYVSQEFMTAPTRFWEVEPDTWRMIVDTNVNGPFLMARAAVPPMLAAGWGRIVNISMSYETMRRRGFSPYGPSKAALESETVIWAQDLAETGITVNALLPGGATDTGMIPDGFPSEQRARLLKPQIMVPPLLWLASRRSDGFTGHRIAAAEWSGAPARDQAGWPPVQSAGR